MSYRITNVHNVLSAATSTPWAILPEKLEEIRVVLANRGDGIELSADDIQARIGARRSEPQGGGVVGSVAVLPLAGSIFPKANMMTEMSGATSLQSWLARFNAAVENPDINAIVIDVDSPGGVTSGVMEAADAIYSARGRKPIVAVANTLMASAAYWLGAQADEVVASPSADVGSVGVYAMHMDATKKLENDGLSATVIKAGRYKAEGNPFEPLSDDAREYMQARVDETYESFVGALARARGLSASQVKTQFGEGRVMSASRALAAGMVDRVATLDDVIAGLAGGQRTRPTNRRAEEMAPNTMAADLAAVSYASAPSAGSVDAAVPTGTITAPQAEEIPVSDTATTAPTGATMQDDRISRLAELVELRPEAAAKLPTWIKNGTSYTDAKAELAAGIPAPAANIVVGAQRETQAPWESLGHFAAAVAKAGTPGMRASDYDPRLFGAATGMNQASPSDGGFAVPGQFNNALWEGLFSDATSILSQTDNYDIDGEFIEMLAVDDTTRATGAVFGGVTAKWLNEGGQIDNSKPKMRKLRLEPQEIAALAYITEKLLNNSPVALGQFLDRAMRGAIALKVNEAIINGDGVGKPKGLLKSGAKITVNKKGSQAAATILAGNISDMKARRIASVSSQYVWLYNTDIEPQLDELSTTVKNVAGTENVGGYASPLYNPNTNRLAGLPMIPNDHCEALGTEGDLMLVYLPAYAVGLRRAGVKTAQSMHLRFDYAEMAFRAMFDIDGQSWLNSALTPAKGSTKSTIITLQTR